MRLAIAVSNTVTTVLDANGSNPFWTNLYIFNLGSAIVYASWTNEATDTNPLTVANGFPIPPNTFQWIASDDGIVNKGPIQFIAATAGPFNVRISLE